MGDTRQVQGRDPNMVDAGNFEVWTVQREHDMVPAVQMSLLDEDVKHISLVHKLCSRDEVDDLIRALEAAREDCWPRN